MESTALSQDTDAQAVRDLILVLADTKRLLGMRYAEWILGAPELEAGIACASMSQDEWGHARILYAMLREYGDDVDAIEHGRGAEEYANLQLLDRPAESWPDLVVLNALADTALSVQLEALRQSENAPLRQRVGKMLDEERFHMAHGVAWFRRLVTASDASRAALGDAGRRAIPQILAWFGGDSQRVRDLVAASIVEAVPSTLRVRYVEKIAPLLSQAGLGDAVHELEPDLGAFDEARRRVGGGGPDEETLARVRGDKNRVFLMD